MGDISIGVLLLIVIVAIFLGIACGIAMKMSSTTESGYQYINTEPNHHGTQWVMLYLYKGEAKYLYFDFKKTMDEFIKITGMTGYKEAE